jgi:hypothetical protein
MLDNEPHLQIPRASSVVLTALTLSSLLFAAARADESGIAFGLMWCSR